MSKLRFNLRYMAVISLACLTPAILATAQSQTRYTYFEQQLRSIDNLLQTGGATRTERASVASQLSEAEGFVLELEFRRDRAKTQIEIATRATSPISITYRDLVELRLEFEQAGLARIRTTYDLEQQKLVLRSLTGRV